MLSSHWDYMAGHGRALEANPTLSFATAAELFPDPGRRIQSRVGSYFGFKNKEKMEPKGLQLVAILFIYFLFFVATFPELPFVYK
ncbi:hypothetical protein FQN60_007587 [Etheostoma spectabile]|uniref:Uncharacterized protein n=1 Tax=Etheostoma spectabile TaxID=54343 RepID=A0A5J5CU98_9PERO|nr:hypothetical protein FQN60_007587 [Etheostoma spectabile]